MRILIMSVVLLSLSSCNELEKLNEMHRKTVLTSDGFHRETSDLWISNGYIGKSADYIKLFASKEFKERIENIERRLTRLENEKH